MSSKVIDLSAFKNKEHFAFDVSRKIRNVLEEAFNDSVICFDTLETLIATELENSLT